MTILTRAVLGALRIAFFGSLKIGLFTYAFFLSNTTLVENGPDGRDGELPADNGHTGRSFRPKEYDDPATQCKEAKHDGHACKFVFYAFLP